MTANFIKNTLITPTVHLPADTRRRQEAPDCPDPRTSISSPYHKFRTHSSYRSTGRQTRPPQHSKTGGRWSQPRIVEEPKNRDC